MSEAAAKLRGLEHAVMWRRRWLALQDRLALALLAGGLGFAALVLLSRLGVVRIHWTIKAGAMVILLVAFLYHWRRTYENGRDAAFLIDRELNLEDRVTTAHQILAHGEPKREVETALIDDAAAHIESRKAAAVAPYRLRAWHALALIGIAATAASLVVPTRQLPGGVAIVEAQADIQSAGEELQEVGEQIARAAPAGSETAKLAREQVELGRAFRMSPESRAQALKQLSALEDRIKNRHTELVSTHADEIVSLAEKRMRNAVEPARKEHGAEAEADKTDGTSDEAALRDQEPDAIAVASPKTRNTDKGRPMTRATSRAPSDVVRAPQTRAARGPAESKDAPRSTAEVRPAATNSSGTTAGDSGRRATPSDQGQKPAGERKTDQAKSNPNRNSSTENKTADAAQARNDGGRGDERNAADGSPPSPSEAVAGGKAPDKATPQADGQPTGEQGAPDQPSESLAPKETPKDGANPLASLAAEQAGKMLPQLSQELLKKAAELRDGKMSADDIKRLQQSAELLARDLSKIAQSKEMQQMAEELAKQITPEQIEQFAKALGNQEQLKRELQASVQLLMQNQQAKSMVAGIAQSGAKWAEQFKGRDRGGAGMRPGEGGPGQQQGGLPGGHGGPSPEDRRSAEAIMKAAGGLTDKADGPRQRTGQGQETRLSGTPHRGSGGEFLFLKSPAGKGASRAPYTSAYPQYRREAERTVERSQVPSRLRSIVKSYFDAINPDAAKKQ